MGKPQRPFGKEFAAEAVRLVEGRSRSTPRTGDCHEGGLRQEAAPCARSERFPDNACLRGSSRGPGKVAQIQGERGGDGILSSPSYDSPQDDRPDIIAPWAILAQQLAHVARCCAVEHVNNFGYPLWRVISQLSPARRRDRRRGFARRSTASQGRRRARGAQSPARSPSSRP
jgi:hypothetical protein